MPVTEYGPSIVGPFTHTLFLGASVAGFSTNIGWNTSPSELTVTLVEDERSGTKLYYNSCLNASVHTGPDRFNPPKLGSPVYFKYGNFTFAGILQNWQERLGIQGKTYTVRITSPQEILEGATVILNHYVGPIFDIPNVINAYAYLEENGTSRSPTTQLTYDSYVLAQKGFQLATGFGGANKNAAGIPWYQLREALTNIINSMSLSQLNTSAWVQAPSALRQYGSRLALGDYNYLFDITSLPILDESCRFDESTVTLLDLVSKICEFCGADFFLDMQLITQPSFFSNATDYRAASTTDDNPYSEGSIDWANYFAGHIANSNSVLKIIRVRPVSRLVQPQSALNLDNSVGSNVSDRLNNLGKISSAISNLNLPISTKNRGLERRNETTNYFVLGDNRQDIWQIYRGTALQELYGTDHIGHWYNSEVTGIYTNTTEDPFSIDEYDKAAIWYYWGKDDNNKPLWSSGVGMNHIVDVELSGKISNLVTYLMFNVLATTKYRIQGLELPSLLTGDKDVWTSLVTSNNYNNNKYMGASGIRQYKLYQTQVKDKNGNIISGSTYTNGWPFKGIGEFDSTTQVPNYGTKGLQFKDGRGKTYYHHATDLASAEAMGQIIATDANSTEEMTASDQLFQYLSQYVREHYGVKFMVKLPEDFAAVYSADDPLSYTTNYEPTDGGWCEDVVLGLRYGNGVISTSGNLRTFGNSVLSLFRNDNDGRIEPFMYFSHYYGAIDFTGYNFDEYYPYHYTVGTGLDQHRYCGYLKYKVEDIVFLDPVRLTGGRAVISISNPIFPYDIFEEQNIDKTISYYRRDWKNCALHTLGIINDNLVPKLKKDAQGRETNEIETKIENGKVVPVLVPVKLNIGADQLAYPFKPFPMLPKAVALPLRSNTACYGPWYASGTMGVNGKTEVIRDPNLNPWNYGSFVNMNAAGYLYLQSRIINCHLTEVGSISIPGAPSMNLGDVLIIGGPEITNIDISFGVSSLETSYQMRTYTPNYGAFAKAKMDQLSRVGRNTAKLVTAQDKAIYSDVKNKKGVSYAGASMWTRSDRFNRSSSHNLWIASSDVEYLPSGNTYDDKGVYFGTGNQLVTWENYYAAFGGLVPTSGTTNTVISSDVRKGLMDLAAHDRDTYLKRAGIEMLGIFRPFTTLSGSLSRMAEIPINTIKEGSVTGWCIDGSYTDTTLIGRQSIPPLYSGYFVPICATTLNPFMHLTSGMTPNGWPMTTGNSLSHDLDMVVRDSGFPQDLSILNTNDYSKYEWYRAVGLRGPVVVVGWGYDIYGRPVPNLEVDPSGNGKTMYFEDDWLRKPDKWKAGPVDLRWDQSRGVWTVPQYQSLYRFYAVEDYSNSKGYFRAYLQGLPSSVLYDRSGVRITDEGALAEIYNPWHRAVCSGMGGYAFYNPNAQANNPNRSPYRCYEIFDIEQPIATLYTTGGGSGVIYSVSMSGPNVNVNLRRWGYVKILNAPDISGYYITAQLTAILDNYQPDSSGGFIPTTGTLVFIPTDYPMPIEGGYMSGVNDFCFSRTNDVRKVTNSLNIPSGIRGNVQWNGVNWVTINSEGFNTPILGVL